MQIKLTPSSKNQYPIIGLLVRGNSPKKWLEQIKSLNIDLSVVKSYSVPSNKANELYGCFILTNVEKETLNQHQPLAAISNNLFIPTNADVFPKLTMDEWQNIFPKPCLFLQEIGIFELEEEINWASIINTNVSSAYTLKPVQENYFIPKKIKSVQMAISEEELLKQMENPNVDAADLKDVPFDMKKVMAGNDKEIEKYLKYIEKHPEFALKHPLPLDVYNTSRNRNDGVFNFEKISDFFGNIFGNFFSSFTENSKMDTNVNNPSNSSTNILLVLGIGVLAIRIIPLLIKNTAPLDINIGTPMLLVIIAFVVILGFLFFSNNLTFGKGTFWQKIIINACLITAIYQLLNPVFTNYKTSIFFKVLISAFSIYIIFKVYNLYSNFLKSK